MGQQQLLLVILVTIIVGIATVVAINTFGSAADSANVDAVRQDVAQIAASAQGFYMKPDMLGGGGKDFAGMTFEDISFAANEISSDGLTAYNENGTYVLDTDGSATGISILAHPSSCDNYSTNRTCGSDDQLSGEIQPDNFSWGS